MLKKDNAAALFKCYTDFLDAKGFGYEKTPEAGQLVLSVKGEDCLVRLLVVVDEASEQTLVYSPLPFEVQRERIMDLVMAVGCINVRLAVGKFFIDAERGDCVYTAHHPFSGLSGFDEAYAGQVIFTAFNVVEMYGDKLFAVS
ncbi:MAG: YbjN domain-containing protein, partial [Clostridiales bacterium]|nr:YbjN domain-containing protein [Clostridiales bacterium]